MPKIVLKPNNFRASSAQLILRITLGLLSLCFIFELYRYSVWGKIMSGIYLSRRSVVLTEFLEFVVLAIQLIMFILSAIYFLRWMHRCYENLGELKKTKRETLWALLSWIVPGINLFMPLLIITEVVLGYEDLLINAQFLRKKELRTSLAIWWWVSFVGGFACFIIGLKALPTVETIPEGLFFRVISILLLIISSLLAIRMISDLKMMEEGVANLDHVSLGSKGSEDILDSEF